MVTVPETGCVTIQDGGSSVTIDSPQLPAALVSGRLDVAVGAALPVGTNAIGKLAANDGIDIGDVTINNAVGGGTEAAALRVTIANDSTGVLSIDDNGAAITVDNGGTFAVQAAQSGTWTVQPGNTANTTPWLTTVQSGTITANAGTGNFNVVGPTANDSPAISNPILIGAVANDAIPAAVSTNGDIVNLWADRRGALKTTLVDAAGDSIVDNTNNSLNVTIVSGGSSGDGSINDGVSSAIKATVLDLTNANPLTVAITDGSGNQITSFGGGAQYTEDAAADANPIGAQLISRRRDVLSSEVTTDGDVIAVNSTAKGELYVKHVDSVAITAAALPLPAGASTLAEQQTQSTILNDLQQILDNLSKDRIKIQKRYDLASTTTNYIATANLGSLSSASAWTIKKITYDVSENPILTQWSADNVSWDDRAIISYS